MNDEFFIKNIGKLKFVATLVDIDYPRAFVCKKSDSSSLELYIFDEFDHGDNYIKWICAQISFDDLDRLNRGLCTLESCFYGPRLTTKSGYIVVSKTDFDAEANFVEDVSRYIKNHMTFIEPFIANEHGVDLYSLVYESPFMSCAIKPEQFADPLIDVTRISQTSSDFKSMIGSLPFCIQNRTNRMAFAQNQSIVLYFEVADKKILPDNQNIISEELKTDVETRAAFDALTKILSSESSVKDVIDAFKGDKKSLEKTVKFINEIKRNNKKNKVLIRMVDYSNQNKGQKLVVSNEITESVLQNVKNKTDEVIRIINKEENHCKSIDAKIGKFLMLDVTGRKRFKFMITEKDNSTTILNGFVGTKINGIKVDEDLNKRYKVRIQTDIVKGDFGFSKPVYTLIEIVNEVKTPEQINIFENKL